MSKTIVEVKDFSYKYPRTTNPVLKNINFNIDEGEYIGIVGPTGSGKTTLCMALSGLIPQVLGGKLTGEILINGKNSKDTSIDEMIFSSEKRESFVGITFQDPEAQLVGMTVEEDIAFGPENLGIEPEKINNVVDEVLNLIRMNSFRDSFPYLLSGGQKQRVGIGATLALRPKLVILDEPTSELDPLGRKEVLNVIKSLKEQKIAVVIVEHNTEELVGFVDRVVVLHEGEVVLDDATDVVFKQTEFLRSIGVRPPEGFDLIERLVSAELLPQMQHGPYDEEAIVQYLSDFIRSKLNHVKANY